MTEAGVPAAHVVTGFREAEEVLRRRNDFLAEGGRGVHAHPFVHGTVLDLDGSDHVARRRILSRLFTEDQLELYEEAVLGEAFQHFLRFFAGEHGHEPDEFDLVPLARSTFWGLAARMVGLDGIDTPSAVADLEATVLPAVEGTQSLFSTKDHDAVRRDGLDALDLFRSRYFEPSLARRQALLERNPTTEMQIDLITLMIAGEPEGHPPDLILRECLLFLGAAVSNTVATASHALAETEGWVRSHPGDRALLTEEAFLDKIIRETVRLHRTGNPYLLRTAAESVTLEVTGRRIERGDRVALDLRRVSRDASVFGADAEVFNPHRAVQGPRVKSYGLAFGSGPHVCLGKSMVVDEGSRESKLRLQGRMLRMLLDAGIRTDSSRTPVRESHGADRYLSYPVVREPATLK